MSCVKCACKMWPNMWPNMYFIYESNTLYIWFKNSILRGASKFDTIWHFYAHFCALYETLFMKSITNYIWFKHESMKSACYKCQSVCHIYAHFVYTFGHFMVTWTAASAI